jgi:hypothetical protein
VEAPAQPLTELDALRVAAEQPHRVDIDHPAVRTEVDGTTEPQTKIVAARMHMERPFVAAHPDPQAYVALRHPLDPCGRLDARIRLNPALSDLGHADELNHDVKGRQTRDNPGRERVRRDSERRDLFRLPMVSLGALVMYTVESEADRAALPDGDLGDACALHRAHRRQRIRAQMRREIRDEQ